MKEAEGFEFVVRCRRCHEVIPPDEDDDTGFCRTDCKPVDKAKLRCTTCATTHIENGQVLPGTQHCKDKKYAYLISASCWNYTAKEVR